LYRAHNLLELFDNVKTLSQFMNRLEKQATQNPDRYPVDMYLGDGWEFFVEALIKTHQYDNRIGIKNYVPVIKNDNGVDGYGINIHGKVCAVQPKYRSNVSSRLTASNDRLDSFISESILAKEIRPDKKYRHFIFTTAKGLHHYTDHEKFRGMVKCYGYDEIRSLIDNNSHFWNFIREQILQFKQHVVSS
jgi:hypothetical protein